MNIHTSYRARGPSIIPAVLALVLSAGCSGDRPEFGPRPAPESDSGVSGEGTSSTSDTSGEGGATDDSSSSDTTTTTSSMGGGSGEDGSDGETTSNGDDVDDTSDSDTSDSDTKEPLGGSDTDTDTADTGSEEPDTDTDTSDTDTGEPDTETSDTETSDTETSDTETSDTETSDTETEEQDASTAPEDDTSSFDCDPDTTRSCSDDDAQGTCGTGTQTCGEDGTWGDCIAPAAEDTCEPGNEDGARCGDGAIDENESCDEGEHAASGGCIDCEIVEGWECDGEPSECVAIEAPVIQSFLTSAVSVPGGGGKVQLSWSVADADSLRIESDQPGAPGDVNGNVVEVDVQADTTFTLVADNEGGRSEESLVIEVNSVGDPARDLIQFGSTEADSVADLAVQSDGSIYVVGSTAGDMDGKNSGRGDAFLAKFSASGAPYWTRQWSSDESTTANSVAVAADGSVYVAGSIWGSDNPGCFLARYFDDGAFDWLRQIDGARNGCAVAVYGSVPYLCSAPVNETRITAFSSENVQGWSESVDFASSSIEIVADCVADAGGVYAVGYSTGTFGGGPGRGMGFSHEGVKLWSLEWSGIDYRSTVGATSFDGALYVVGSAEPDQDFLSTSAGSSDAIVARRSTSDGELLDGVQFGSSGGDSGEDVAVDLRGNILVVGSADSSLRSGQSGRHFVAKRTQDNQEVWTRQFGPTDDSGGATAVVVAPNGTVVVAGTTSEELSPGAPGGGDAYLYIFK